MSSRFCFVCEDDSRLLSTCERCNELVCPEHLLPENHDCISLAFQEQSWEQWSEQQKRLGGSGKTIKGSERIDFRTDQESSGRAVIWECHECDAEYSTNQNDCVRCGSTVLEPIIVSTEEREEKLPDLARKRRRERKEKRAAEREEAQKADQQRAEQVSTSLWEPCTSLLLSVITFQRTKSLTSISDEVFVKRGGDFIRFRPANSGSKFYVTTYDWTDPDPGIYRLEKVGTRTYTPSRMEANFSKRITKIGDCEWLVEENILELD